MVRSTMVNGMRASLKDLESKFGQMAVDMKVTGRTESNMDRANMLWLMALLNLGFGKMEKESSGQMKKLIPPPQLLPLLINDFKMIRRFE